MKTTRLILGVALFTLGSAGTTMACKYCFGGGAFDGADPSQAPMRMHGTTAPGEFPLDATISQIPSNGAPAALATPPPAASIVTNAADLRPAATLPATPVASKSVAAPAPVSARPVVAEKATSIRWADAGLLGLAAVGGIFGWRTRRRTGPLS